MTRIWDWKQTGSIGNGEMKMSKSVICANMTRLFWPGCKST